MEFGFTEEQQQLQREASEFFRNEVTEEVLRDTEAGHDLGAAGRQLLAKMGRKGWVAPTWPKEYGGLGSSNVDRQIIVEERVYHGGPWILHGADIAGPVILRFGTEEQKREYLRYLSNLLLGVKPEPPGPYRVDNTFFSQLDEPPPIPDILLS